MTSQKKILIVAAAVLAVMIFLSVIMYLFLYGFGWLMFEYTEKVTFSDKFVGMVSDNFGIDIPEGAELLGGEYSPAMAQDPSVEFVFRLDVSEGELKRGTGEESPDYVERVVSSMVHLPYRQTDSFINSAYAEEKYGIKFTYAYELSGDLTWQPEIYCTEPVDSETMYFYVICWF